jgi:hypothetical protein
MNKLKIFFAVLSFLVFQGSLFGAAKYNEHIVEFTGVAQDGDLSNPANWSGNLSADATAAITENSLIPSSGLKLTGSLTAGFLKIDSPSSTELLVDLAGGNFNVPDIRVNDSVNRKARVILSGGANNITNIYVSASMSLILTNGVYTMPKGNFYCYNWNTSIIIAKDAEFIVKKVANNRTSGTNSGQANIIVDGGKMTIDGYNDPNWSIIKYGNNYGPNYLKIINGGEYYESTTPQFEIKGNNSNFLLCDSSYISTNSTGASRNMMLSMENSRFAVTNSTLKVAQIYCSTLSHSQDGWYFGLSQQTTNTVFTFNNSNVELAFPPGSGYSLCSGLYFSSNATKNVVLVDGPNSVFKTQNLMIAGKTNSFEMADGEFYVYRYLYTGTEYAGGGIGNTVKFSGGDSKIKRIITSYGTNSTIEVTSTADVEVSDEIYLGGLGSKLKVSGGKLALEKTDSVRMLDSDTSYEITGGAVTSRVSFLSSNCRFYIGNGATNVSTVGESQNGRSPILFNEGYSNNIFVISNGTFLCNMGFAKAIVRTDTGPKSEAIPFTNCPNCRIEFQGESPSFLITSASSYGKEEPWYSAAFGCSYLPGKLKDPLRLRFALPENGYASAPIQVLSARSVWGGNAEFEFDISGFKWPSYEPLVIPLVYDQGCFKGWNNTLYIDVDGLNETNAERLPVCPSASNIKARFVLGEDGKTLYMYCPASGGTVLLIQ